MTRDSQLTLQLLTSQSVEQCGGSIVNFIGDAVLGAFNTPIPIPEPAVAALRCYVQARRMLAEATISRNLVSCAVEYNC